MAGPEDSTASHHHHGNADTADHFLHQTDLEADADSSLTKDVMKPARLPDARTEDADPENALAMGGKMTVRRVSFADAPPEVLPADVQVRGKQSAQPQGAESDCDVFEVTSPQKIFFFEDDEEDEEKVTDTAQAQPGDGRLYSEDDDSSDVEMGAGCSTQNEPPTDRRESGRARRKKSAPISIQMPTDTSGLTTSCRCSNSHLVVRCQISPRGTATDMSLPLSCPAFSPRWREVMTSFSPRDFPARRTDRPLRRRYTVANYDEAELGQLQRDRQVDQEVDQTVDADWQHSHAPAFRTTRSRSYSDTDVNHLMNKEVGREIRRISDEFNFSYRGAKLTTVTESTDEGSGNDLHPFR